MGKPGYEPMSVAQNTIGKTAPTAFLLPQVNFVKKGPVLPTLLLVLTVVYEFIYQYCLPSLHVTLSATYIGGADADDI